MISKLRETAKQKLSTKTKAVIKLPLDTARYAFNRISEIRKLDSTKDEPQQRYPLAISTLEEILVDKMGIQEGACVHFHSSLRHLLEGSLTPPNDGYKYSNRMSYAYEVIKLLKRLVGESGTLTTVTCMHSMRQFYRLMEGDSADDLIFDLRTSPTNRGLISEMFRKSKGTLRSINPIYNVSAWGKHASYLIENNQNAAPYVAGEDSAWQKMHELSFRGLLLGDYFHSNVPNRYWEYHPSYQRPIFYDKPIVFPVRDYNGGIIRVPLYMQPPDRSRYNSIDDFSNYMNDKYGIYTIVPFESSLGGGIVSYDLNYQTDCAKKEIDNGVYATDVKFRRAGIHY